MATDPFDACPDNTSHWAWPPDLNNNTTVNILDIALFKPVIGSDLGGPDLRDRNYDRRYDFNADTKVNILDVVLPKPHMGTSCTQ
jgi:hypothetical protein